MEEIIIRFNTKFADTQTYWRVIVNGQEHLAEDLIIYASPVYTKETMENGFPKWNIACRGRVEWQDRVAIIHSS
jgi:hypothetical protein